MTKNKSKNVPISDKDISAMAEAMRNSISVQSMLIREKLFVDKRTGKVVDRKVEYQPLTINEALALAYCDQPGRKLFTLESHGGIKRNAENKTKGL